VGSPPQYSPALRRVTTGFGMGPGGAGALTATGAPDPPTGGRRKLPSETDSNPRPRTTGSPRFRVRAPHTVCVPNLPARSTAQVRDNAVRRPPTLTAWRHDRRTRLGHDPSGAKLPRARAAPASRSFRRSMRRRRRPCLRVPALGH